MTPQLNHVITLPAPGRYRTRVQVPGGELGRAAVVVTGEPVEHHPLVLRPSRHAAGPVLIHGPDAVAMSYR